MSTPMGRWTAVVVLALVAFSASYTYAQTRSAAPQNAAYAAAASPNPLAGASAGGGCCGGGAPASQSAPSGATGGGGCCGGGAPAGAATTKKAELKGGVQRIAVDVSKGYYDPSTIELKAGIPAEITFSAAAGCTGYVQSADLGFAEDLTSGPRTVNLPGLTAGKYGFACGMNMVSGSIVVK